MLSTLTTKIIITTNNLSGQAQNHYKQPSTIVVNAKKKKGKNTATPGLILKHSLQILSQFPFLKTKNVYDMLQQTKKLLRDYQIRSMKLTCTGCIF